MGHSCAVTRVAVLDDHAVVRCGVAACLAQEPDIAIVGSFRSSQTMIASLQNAPADVLLVDYSLGPNEVDGVSLIRALLARFPRSAIIVFSSHQEAAIVSLALRVGARGFVGKRQDMANVVTAIRAVARGRTYIDPDIAYRLAGSAVTEPARQTAACAAASDCLSVAGVRLSAKESEVIRCLLKGMTVTQIARTFERSDKTISTQKWAAYRKLGVDSDAQLFKLKHQLGAF